MKFSRINPADLWDQHVKRLESIHSTLNEMEDFLGSVRERRASPRHRSLYLSSYIPKKGEQQEFNISLGRTLDVSEGGVKIETHRKLDNGTELELDIAIEDEIISAKGKVLYSGELEDGLFGTGVNFISINEEDRRLLRS